MKNESKEKMTRCEFLKRGFIMMAASLGLAVFGKKKSPRFSSEKKPRLTSTPGRYYKKLAG